MGNSFGLSAPQGSRSRNFTAWRPGAMRPAPQPRVGLHGAVGGGHNAPSRRRGEEPIQVQHIIVADSTPAWPACFERQRLALAALFARASIEHVGSTSVPGLAAKPVIDILIGASSLVEIEAQIAPLAALGFTYFPQHERVLPQRRYFARAAAAEPAVHLHAVVKGSAFWAQHRAFRDALRRQPRLAMEYAALKRRLAQQFANDREAYTDAKAPFIQAVLARQGGAK